MKVTRSKAIAELAELAQQAKSDNRNSQEPSMKARYQGESFAYNRAIEIVSKIDGR